MPSEPTTEAPGSEPRRSRALAMVVLAAIAFSTSAPLARVARPTHPLLVAALRVAIAALVLGLVDLRGLARSARALAPVDRARVGFAGALLGAHFAFFQWGLDTTSLPAAASLVSLEPLAVVLVAWAKFGLRPSTRETVGVAVATLGALLVSLGAGSGGHRVLGDALVVGAVVLYGFYVASARALRDAIPARHYAPLVYASAALVLALAVIVAPIGSIALPSTVAMGAIVALALVPTCVGHTLVQTSARTASPALVALVSPGETLGSVAIAALLLGERPSSREALGGAVILLGATFAATSPQRAPRSPQPSPIAPPISPQGAEFAKSSEPSEHRSV